MYRSVDPEMISKYLNSCGHSCTTSNDGREGLSLILEQSFDAILLDLTMPEFSGFDIIESLVQTSKIKEQKILVFSANNVEEDEIKKLKDISNCLVVIYCQNSQ